MNPDDNRQNDRSARRTLILIGGILLIALAVSIYALAGRPRAQSPAGDLAPLSTSGG